MSGEISTAQLCRIFGVVDRTARRWKNEEGLPSLGPNRWHVFQVLSWWFDFKAYEKEESEVEAALERMKKITGLDFDDYLDWLPVRVKR